MTLYYSLKKLSRAVSDFLIEFTHRSSTNLLMLKILLFLRKTTIYALLDA